MATFQELQRDADERKLIRKVQRALAMIRVNTGELDLPTTLMDTAGSYLDLKAEGFFPVGIVSPDGYTFGRDVTNDEIDALGYAEPVREDTIRVARTVSFTPLETGRKHMLELRYGVNLDDTQIDPDTGAFYFDEPSLPVNDEYQLIIAGIDGPASDQWLLGRGYGSVKLSESGEETWGSEGAVSSDLTLRILPDENTGTPVRHYFGGTGVLNHHDTMGFDLAA